MRRIRRMALSIGLLAAAAVFGALLVASAGLVPIAASAGHTELTAWFLHYTMRRSVKLQSLGIEAPPLDDPRLLLRGAAHYASECAQCHGAPGRERALFAVLATPEPPALAEKPGDWDAAERFWIVRHGIKYTSMPAWAALAREDEIWAMVAFLQQLPGMSPQAYDRLAFGDAVHVLPSASDAAYARPLRQALPDCSRCHGVHGRGREGAFPRLAGQSQAYLLASLRAYAAGRRHSGFMQPVAAGLQDESLRALAAHYAALPAAPADGPLIDLGDPARGARIATEGLPEAGVPACEACHGARPADDRGLFPALAGQPAEYLRNQLAQFKAGHRGGTAYAHIMQSVAERLDAAQAADVAAHYAGRDPAE